MQRRATAPQAPYNRESRAVTSTLFRLRCAGILVGALIASAAQAQVAGIHVPAGGQVQLAGGELRVGCADLSVAGVFNAGSGRVGILDSLLVDPGGQFALGSATLPTTSRTFSAGTGRAELGDDCAASSRIVGVDGFHALSIQSSLGKRFLLVAGRTLQISAALQVSGVDGQNVRVESDPIAEPSYVRLAAGAALALDHVNLRAGNVHLLCSPPPSPLSACAATDPHKEFPCPGRLPLRPCCPPCWPRLPPARRWLPTSS